MSDDATPVPAHYRSRPRTLEPLADEVEIRRRWGGTTRWWWLLEAAFGWLALFGAYLLTLGVGAPALPWLVTRIHRGLPAELQRAAVLSFSVARIAAWITAAIGLFAVISALRDRPEHWKLAMRLAQPPAALGALALALAPSQMGVARGMPGFFAMGIWGAVVVAGGYAFWGIGPSSEPFLRSLAGFAALMAALGSVGSAWMHTRLAVRRVTVFHRLETDAHEFRALVETDTGTEIHTAAGVALFRDLGDAREALRKAAFESSGDWLRELSGEDRPAIAAHSDDLRAAPDVSEVTPNPTRPS